MFLHLQATPGVERAWAASVFSNLFLEFVDTSNKIISSANPLLSIYSISTVITGHKSSCLPMYIHGCCICVRCSSFTLSTVHVSAEADKVELEDGTKI